jgi:hypothetical protein
MVARDGIERPRALKTGKLLIFQRPKNPKNLQKPIWRYIGGTQKSHFAPSTQPHLRKRISEAKHKSRSSYKISTVCDYRCIAYPPRALESNS